MSIQESLGNVSLHLMCRSDDKMTVITTNSAGFEDDKKGSPVFYLTRVDPGAVYYLVSNIINFAIE